MDCRQAEPLIPSYLDGELSEGRAAPLRRHLLDCQPCRAGAQGEKNFKRWFAESAPVAVPKGFAARVARRAFAGDAGEGEATLRPAPAIAGPRLSIVEEAAEKDDGLLRFVLEVTAAAALVVIALSVALRSLSLPAGTSLRAEDGRDAISVEQALDRLEQLNRVEIRKGALVRQPEVLRPSSDVLRPSPEVSRPTERRGP